MWNVWIGILDKFTIKFRQETRISFGSTPSYKIRDRVGEFHLLVGWFWASGLSWGGRAAKGPTAWRYFAVSFLEDYLFHNLRLVCGAERHRRCELVGHCYWCCCCFRRTWLDTQASWRHGAFVCRAKVQKNQPETQNIKGSLFCSMIFAKCVKIIPSTI